MKSCAHKVSTKVVLVHPRVCEALDLSMRTHGTLTKWNDERGFGFISPAEGGGEIFVHISAFPPDGKRPQLNELISYETDTSPDGKSRAVRVMRPGGRVVSRQRRSPKRGVAISRSLVRIIVVLAIAAIGVYGYSRLSGPATSSGTSKPRAISSSVTSAQNFRCDGRTMCSQMTSCAEARYFLQNCPGTRMDGDNDGEPCEQQWCN